MIQLHATRINISEHRTKTGKGVGVPKRDTMKIVAVAPACWDVSDSSDTAASVGSIVMKGGEKGGVSVGIWKEELVCVNGDWMESGRCTLPVTRPVLTSSIVYLPYYIKKSILSKVAWFVHHHTPPNRQDQQDHPIATRRSRTDC